MAKLRTINEIASLGGRSGTGKSKCRDASHYKKLARLKKAKAARRKELRVQLGLE